MPFGSQWTLSFWARNDSCSNNQIALLFDDNSSWLADLYHTAAFYAPGGYAFAIHDSNCSSYTNTWRHFVYQDEGGNIRVWSNGSELTGTSYDTYRSLSGIGLNRFMSKPSFGTNGLSGQMDDLAIYDTPLAATEIQRIYDQASSGRPVRWQ